MKSIIMSIVREFKLIFRDGITIYMAIAPALLALVFIFVFGSVQQSSISLAVEKSLPQEYITKLQAVADIEYLNDLEALKSRVKGPDSIAGVYMQDGNIKVLVEGNEAQGFAESRQALVSTAVSSNNLVYESEMIKGKDSLAFIISMASIFLLSLFMGGAALGIGGVAERESGVIRALSISPMSLWAYIISKIIPALLFGIIGVSASSLIMGRADALPQFIMLAISSVFVSGMIIFIIITLAGNQIAAVGALKIIMPLFLAIGISAVFIPQKWIVLYYALPMYWQYTAIDAIITNMKPSFQFIMIFTTSLPWFFCALIIFVKKVKMRDWR